MVRPYPYSRLNDKQKGAIVLIMHRLQESLPSGLIWLDPREDLVGHVLAQEDWEVVRFAAMERGVSRCGIGRWRPSYVSGTTRVCVYNGGQSRCLTSNRRNDVSSYRVELDTSLFITRAVFRAVRRQIGQGSAAAGLIEGICSSVYVLPTMTGSWRSAERTIASNTATPCRMSSGGIG